MTGPKEELLSAAKRRLLSNEPEAPQGEPDNDGGHQVMYRGQPVRRHGKEVKVGEGSEAEARRAILRLKKLYHEGLISREEAKTKRAEILARLEQNKRP